MGRLVDGKWVKTSIVTSDNEGRYDRIPRTFRKIIGHKSPHPVESGRYHLYISYACPWAHRTMIYRHLKGLNDHISFSVVHPDMLELGWTFEKYKDGNGGDDLYGLSFLHQLYQKAQKDISTSVTVPVLWDKKTETIVNNESSEIIRIFNEAFNELTDNKVDYYPEKLKNEIDELNELIYENINNGVYLCGFAQNQNSYDEAVTKLFKSLDHLELRLEGQKFLLGEEITEADLRLIPTLLRFDLVYFTHFKCNIRRIKDYKNLSRYTLELYKVRAICETTNFDHIKRHYYYSHEIINPKRIIPLGPEDIF